MNIIYRIFVHIIYLCNRLFDNIRTFLIFNGNGVIHGNYKTMGVPRIITPRRASIIIGDGLYLCNSTSANLIGYNYPCVFTTVGDAFIRIGNNVGISQSVFIAHSNITIGDNVRVGSGCKFYTSDFHSLDYLQRRNDLNKNIQIQSKPIKIGDDVFLGAGTTVLKGVSIGAKSIIGACSLVTKDIPEGEIWGGVPAKFIRKI